VPEEMSEDAKDLIDKLLARDPSKRLGTNSASEVKAHPFFSNIDWDTFLEKSLEYYKPFLPKPKDKTDTGHFWDRNSMYAHDSDPFATERKTPDTVLDQVDFSNFSFKNLASLGDVTREMVDDTLTKLDD